MSPTADELALRLSEGLDLCVRARKLDEAVMLAAAIGDSETKCLTPALWVQDAYDRDLAAWEAASKALLTRMPMFSTAADGAATRQDGTPAER
jgi:hypothetical protein